MCQSSRCFFLESSWSGNFSSAEEKRRRAVDPWRKKILAASLNQLAVGEGNLVRSLPAFEPSYLKELCILFWTTLQGKGEISNGKPIISLAELKRINEQVSSGDDDTGSKPPSIVPISQFSSSLLAPILMSLLEDVSLMFDAGPNNRPKVIQALETLFQYYCTPKYQLPAGRIVEAAVPANLSELWDKHGAEMQNMLQAIYVKYQADELPPQRPFGRFAETYCFIYMH